MSARPVDAWEWIERLQHRDAAVVSWTFASRRVTFSSWSEIHFGLVNGLAGVDTVRGFAESLVLRGDEGALEILLLDDDVDALLKVEEFARATAPGVDARRRWVPVVLDWVRTGNPEPGWEPVSPQPGLEGRIAALGSAWASLGYPDGLGFLVPWGEGRVVGPLEALTTWLRTLFRRAPAPTGSPEQWWEDAERRLDAWIQDELLELRGQ